MEHDERVKDIIAKSEKLLAKKGYDKTSVADIIKKVGICYQQDLRFLWCVQNDK
jgi:AcrR family transcriptional regulator